MIGLMSSPGTHPAETRATRDNWRRSLSSASRAPGYWILTATVRPSRATALCTWPIEAAAAGTSSKSRNFAVRHRGPSSRASTSWTASGGRGGAASCRRVNVAR